MLRVELSTCGRCGVGSSPDEVRNEEALAKTHTHSNACYLLSCSQIPHEDKWMGVQNLANTCIAETRTSLMDGPFV